MSAVAFTVRVAEPVIPLCAAEMVAVPALTALAVDPLMLATEGFPLDQVTDCVQSLLELFANRQVAENGCVLPTTMDAVLGVMVMLESAGAGAFTIRVVEPVTPLCTAEMVALPALTALAVEPLMLATEELLLDQVTDFVQSCWVLSDMEQVATKGCVWPTVIAGELGVTAIPESIGVLGVPGVPTPPLPAFVELADPEPQPAIANIRNEAAHKRIQPDPNDPFAMKTPPGTMPNSDF